MKIARELYARRLNHTADTVEKQAKRHWAAAKNGAPGYEYARARESYARVKKYRELAKAVQSGGEKNKHK